MLLILTCCKLAEHVRLAERIPWVTCYRRCGGFLNFAFEISCYRSVFVRGESWMYLQEQSPSVELQPQRRRHPRVQVQCRARIHIGPRHYAGYLDNISVGGARLRTISPIRRVGEINLRLPDLPAMRCRLCWTDAYHAGVEFEVPLQSRQLSFWLSSRANSWSVSDVEITDLANDLRETH